MLLLHPAEMFEHHIQHWFSRHFDALGANFHVDCATQNINHHGNRD